VARVLVVSQYFPPELGAAQNRVGAFVSGLAIRGHELTVVCEQPNHPAGIYHPGYGRRPVVVERDGSVTLRRLWVAASPHKTKLRRIGFYGSFAAAASVAIAVLPRHDVLFTSSPPLPAALVAGGIAVARGTPLVLDVRDIWPAAAEALGELSNRRLLRALEHGERFLYEHAERVTTTTHAFCRHIDGIAGRPVAEYLPNGASDALLDMPEPARDRSRPFLVAYVGNLGVAQGLDAVLDAADRLRGAPVRFLLVGDGPRAAELRSARDVRRLDNVELRPGVPPDRVADVLMAADALLVPLGAQPLLDVFIPSKLYDAMAVGKPVIASVRGEAAELVRGSGCGLLVPPEDGEALARGVLTLARDPGRARALGRAGRETARRHARSRQVDRLNELIVEASAKPVPREVNEPSRG
jgi:glycosyltransferase involved in cell wall biosynthesis